MQVTNLVKISADVGIGRTVKGNNVCYPFGKPSLSKKCEYEYRKSLVEETLHALIEVQEKKKCHIYSIRSCSFEKIICANIGIIY